MTYTRTILTGAVMAGVAVATGAFGAHALEDVVSAERLATWETAVQYQMYHALALLVIGILQKVSPETKLLSKVAALFILGIFVFSGSLYTLVLSGIGWLGAITPIGGVAFIGGWIVLGVAALKIGKET